MAWAPPYATPTELAHFMGDGAATDTAELTLAIESASRSIDRLTGRQFGTIGAAESRYYTAQFDRYRRRWIINTDDFSAVDGVTVENIDPPGGGLIEQWLPGPVNAVANGGVWTQIVLASGAPVAPTTAESGVRVTGVWGWPEVPPTIKLATLLQASRLFSRRHAPFGILGSPESGGELRLLERLDADVSVSVRPYIRVWGAV